jgi:hypothetical protein
LKLTGYIRAGCESASDFSVELNEVVGYQLHVPVRLLRSHPLFKRCALDGIEDVDQVLKEKKLVGGHAAIFEKARDEPKGVDGVLVQPSKNRSVLT